MPTPDPYLPGHGDTRYRVQHHDLRLDYKVATNRLDEVAILELTVAEKTATIELDLFGLVASKVRVDEKKARFRQTKHKVVVDVGPRQPGEELVVEVTCSGKPRPVPGVHGAAGWEELTDGVLVGSQPQGAPGWFPCNDDAADKATYRIRVAVAAGYHVVANGSLVEVERHGGTWHWTYLMDRPMAPYLASVQIGRYVVDERIAVCGSRFVPVEVVHPSKVAVGQGTSFARQEKMVELFSELFGPYPFTEYRAVVTDDPLEIPLEAQGLSSFGRNFARPTWENERLVAHELSHQWFGNSLTAEQLSMIWLHEGFACYAEWLWADVREGIPGTQEQASRHHAGLAAKPQDLVLGAPGMKDMFDDRVYKRGALTLHAVRVELGEAAFFDMLRAWTAEHAHGVVTTADFVAHAQRFATDPARLAEVLEAWLYRPELPPLPVLG